MKEMEVKIDDLKIQVRQELMKNDNIEKVCQFQNFFIIRPHSEFVKGFGYLKPMKFQFYK